MASHSYLLIVWSKNCRALYLVGVFAKLAWVYGESNGCFERFESPISAQLQYASTSLPRHSQGGFHTYHNRLALRAL